MNIKKLIKLYHTNHKAFWRYIDGIDNAIENLHRAKDVQNMERIEGIRVLQPKYVQQLENQIKTLEKFQRMNNKVKLILSCSHHNARKDPNSDDSIKHRQYLVAAYFKRLEAAVEVPEGVVKPLEHLFQQCESKFRCRDRLEQACVRVFDEAGLRTHGSTPDPKHIRLQKDVELCWSKSPFIKRLRWHYTCIKIEQEYEESQRQAFAEQCMAKKAAQ